MSTRSSSSSAAGLSSTRSGMPILPTSCRIAPRRMVSISSCRGRPQPRGASASWASRSAWPVHALVARFDRIGERARQRRCQQALTEISSRSGPRGRAPSATRSSSSVWVNGFVDKAVRAAGQRLAQVVARARAGDEHDRQVRPPDAHRLEQLEARAVGHEDVRDHEAECSSSAKSSRASAAVDAQTTS